MTRPHVGTDRPEEWIGALVTFPSYVTNEGTPYRPTAILWLEPHSQQIVDTELVRPEEALARAAGLFQLATREPKSGEPRVPRRLRVSDEVLAKARRGSVGDVELVVAPTPEIDDVVASLLAHLEEGQQNGEPGEGEDDGWTFFEAGAEPADVAAMFAAAARLFVAAPWSVIPGDVLVGVTCDLLKIESGGMVVVGQMGESFGFSLFSTIEDALAFYDAVEAHERGERIAIPEHLMFAFDERDEVHPALLAEIDRHGWPVASASAYPHPKIVNSDLAARGLTRTELVGVTAIMTAMAELVESEPDDLAAVWDDDEATITWNRTVRGPLGDVSVELRAPVELAGHGHDHAEMAGVETFAEVGGVVDEEAVEDFAHALLHELEEFPDVEEMHLRFADLLIQQSAIHYGLPITQLPASALRELLLQVLPAKVAIDAKDARYVIEAARLVMEYADETLGVKSAADCRALLREPSIVDQLVAGLADDRRYSPVKSMLMEGLRAGYDLSTESGVAAWVEQLGKQKKSKAQPRAKAKSTTKPKARAMKSAKAKAKAKAAKASPTKMKARAKPLAKRPAKRGTSR